VDDPKSAGKDINTTDTTGAHVGDATTPEDATTSGGARIGAHAF